MSRLRLTLACDDYELVRPLVDGTVKPEGIDLVMSSLTTPERFERIVVKKDVDVCELATGTVVMAAERGYPFTAIPIFPHRRFRLGFVFVNSQAGIAQPKDLEGKRVGMRSLQSTAGIWLQGMLQSHYGVDLRRVRWCYQEVGGLPFDLPAIYTYEKLPLSANIEQMLASGELDAVLDPVVLSAAAAGTGPVRRLFNDLRAEEAAFFRATGLFPMTQTFVVRDDLLAEEPWIAQSLVKAFDQAKRLAYRRLAEPDVIPLAWLMWEQEEQRRLLGDDPYPNGLGPANRRAFDTLIGYCLDLGLIKRCLAVEEIFAPSTAHTLPRYL